MIEVSDVYAAYQRIRPYVVRTPLLTPDALGGNISLKCENLQKTNSFKARGAFNAVLSLPEEERARGVCCYSSGNHAQAVAYAAKRAGTEAWVYMPENAIRTKVEACEALGAHVVLTGSTGAEAYPKAVAFSKEHDIAYIDPVEDPFIMAGQGTLGLEILADLPDVDVVFVPVGGGGLISGVSTAVKGLRPDARVIGVEPENMNCMGASFAAGRPTKIERRYSVADGLAGDIPGPLAFECAHARVDEMITVTDDQILDAMGRIMKGARLMIEPSAAASVAGALFSGMLAPGEKAACVLSGGNADWSFAGDVLKK